MHTCKELLYNCSSVCLRSWCIVPVCVCAISPHIFPAAVSHCTLEPFTGLLCVEWWLQRVKGLFIQLSILIITELSKLESFCARLERGKYDGHLGYSCQHCLLFCPSNSLTSIFSHFHCPILCFYCANPPMFSSVSCTFFLNYCSCFIFCFCWAD